MEQRKIEYYEKKYERNPVEDAIKAISNKYNKHYSEYEKEDLRKLYLEILDLD